MNIRRAILTVMTLLVGMTLVQASAVRAGGGDDEAGLYRFVLTPKAGEELVILGPSAAGGGGLNGNVYSLKRERPAGQFTTDIKSGEIIYNILLAMVAGPAGTYQSAGSVQGVFETPFGNIIDLHSPTIFSIDEEPKVPGRLVMVATAEGEITGGTMIFRRASGTTSLYLKFEVDPVTLTAYAVAGSFMFTLQDEPKSASTLE